MANPQYAEGEVIANKYVVEGALGESPSARTFLANGNAGKLCVKFYKPEISAKLLSAPDFFLKAGVMTEIEHDNLCGCLDVQEEMGMVFVARAYAEGESFEEWLRKHRNDANYFSRGLELLWQISQGLAAIHERARHLNIHPGNIIVGPMVAKLCDWDPRALGSMEMTSEPLPGRPEYQGYRAPEAAGRGSFLSYPSTDLFAVAGLLYRLVRGEHPSVNPAQTLGEVRAFDKDLAVFLSKALHPKPEERFQEASGFSDALWDLQGAMQKLQEKNSRPGASAQRAPEPARQADPFFAETSDAGFASAGKEPTLFGATKPAANAPAASAPAASAPASGNDTFFNFFPPADAAPAQPAAASAAYKAPQPPPAKGGGDTLFGAPDFSSNKPVTSLGSNPQPSFQPPRQTSQAHSAPAYTPPPQPASGMSSLEAPGTLYGSTSSPSSSPSSLSSSPLFASSAPSKPAPRAEPPPAAKPLAVSLSSLEKDPMDMTAGGEGGFTQFGFKGAGENKTLYAAEKPGMPAKTKLMILLGAAGGLILIVGLLGLFLYLRSTAAPKMEARPAPVEEPAAASPAPQSAPSAEAPSTAGSAGLAPAAKHAKPAAVRPEPASRPQAEPAPPAPAPKATGNTAATSPEGYSEPPMPTEPPRPGSQPEAAPARAEASPAKPARAEPQYKGNNHVTPEREAALMAMVQTQNWPASAAERLKAADDLNDLGKTAEANMAYGKALKGSGLNDKMKVSAYGGLAVTFQSMGMKDQARDAVDQILSINPKNGFALKLKEKLK